MRDTNTGPKNEPADRESFLRTSTQSRFSKDVGRLRVGILVIVGPPIDDVEYARSVRLLKSISDEVYEYLTPNVNAQRMIDNEIKFFILSDLDDQFDPVVSSLIDNATRVRTYF
jgi:hypothetical protein